jgi:Kef-type K+ transport system membrane component KefB
MRFFRESMQGTAWVVTVLTLTALSLSPTVHAAETSGEGGMTHWGTVFLMFLIVLMAGKIGDVVEKYGQPPVIGQLLAGIILAVFGYMGWGFMGEIAHNQSIAFLSSLGALLLLFAIGLESNIGEMKKVGFNALLVALIGVAVPFFFGTWVLGPIFFGNESMNARLFLGASLVATSVGITASVFKSLGILKSRASQTVLGAAVIDDVLGLIVLAVVSALVSGGEANVTMVAELVFKSFGFLGGALLIGTLAAGYISKVFSYISTGHGMKLGVALAMALGFGYLAELFGLEPIIGAFAAGLVLDSVHFNAYQDPELATALNKAEFSDEADAQMVKKITREHSHKHVEDLIGTFNLVFVPIFFVYTGMQINIESLLKPELYGVAAIIALVAIAGKLVAGVAAKGDLNEKLLVGMSMVPRGEVGLIFAATGQALGVLSDELFSVIILVVIITTFISPPLISRMAGSKTN